LFSLLFSRFSLTRITRHRQRSHADVCVEARTRCSRTLPVQTAASTTSFPTSIRRNGRRTGRRERQSCFLPSPPQTPRQAHHASPPSSCSLRYLHPICWAFRRWSCVLFPSFRPPLLRFLLPRLYHASSLSPEHSSDERHCVEPVSSRKNTFCAWRLTFPIVSCRPNPPHPRRVREGWSLDDRGRVRVPRGSSQLYPPSASIFLLTFFCL
jgi:hypothetical protein